MEPIKPIKVADFSEEDYDVDALAVELDYKSPEGSTMRLRMTFSSRDAWQTWIKGLCVLHAATLDEDPAKVGYLQSARADVRKSGEGA